MKYLIFLFLFFACTNIEQKEIRSDATVAAKGMSCPMCANNIDRLLKKVPGVEDAHVNLKSGLVIIQFKPGHKPSLTELTRAVEDAGFTAENAKYSQ